MTAASYRAEGAAAAGVAEEVGVTPLQVPQPVWGEAVQCSAAVLLLTQQGRPGSQRVVQQLVLPHRVERGLQQQQLPGVPHLPGQSGTRS